MTSRLVEIQLGCCRSIRATETNTNDFKKVGTVAEASGISREEVAGIARLARIAVSDEELDQLAGQLDTIVEAVSAVQAVDTEGVEPMSHPHSVEAAMREDVQRTTLTQAQALDQAPEVEDDRFMVPQILGEED